MTTLEILERDLDRARAALDRAYQNLHEGEGADRHRIYGTQEHTRRLLEALAAFDEKANRITQDTTALIQHATTEMRESYADLSQVMTEAELQQANLHRPYAETTVMQASFLELVKQADAALASKDRASMFLIAFYGQRRLEREQERGYHRTSDGLPVYRDSGSDVEGMTAFSGKLADLDRQLRDPKGTRQAAQQRISRAHQLLSDLQSVRFSYDETAQHQAATGLHRVFQTW